ncbi:trafficking protein particle complex subunit 12 [Cajanus cajan]|uniref:Tetratricopeptide repeat protein 15 n=1 Tax=Cajanus cajan TaxID=3821 RepID=A0A151U955_CAJCA|nr:trafficking protein particle complex subunit 12 [Cajanus cajan]KYP75833.1 Tetratricopeptide repeat protein 15 [Cajanus cajan]
MDSDPATSDPETQPFSKQIDDQCHDMSSLEDLANRGAWRSIIDKVSRARALSLLHKPHDHLTYLAFNALAFTKLRRFNEASAELDSLEDLQSSHYRYETYPKIYPNRVGSMVPFSLRWLHALIPIKLGQRQQGMDRFYTLLDFVRQKIKEKENNDALNVSLSLWRKREVFVVNCIIGHHLSQKEFGVCLSLMKELLSRSSDPLLVSQLGYMQLQVGDLEGAKVSFLKVESEGKSNGSLSEVEFRNLVNRNKALVYLVGKDYVSAVREFEECIERDSSDVVAVNNKALCLMYLRDLSDSIKVLESALERVPTLALNETLVVNLCSMYELAYVNHSDIKRTLSSWIARVAPDDFDASCTRT